MSRERSIDETKRKELINHYEELKSLKKGMTPQTRGQKFNNFISRILNEYGWRAKPNYIEGTGEIDVAFQIEGTRFILEAKWEKDNSPVNIDPISKVYLRLKQRLGGTIGIVLSMSGFTKPALDETRQLGILLLTREHFEAILYGMVTPKSLLENILDNAHFNGNPLSPLAKLSSNTIPKENLIWSFENKNQLEIAEGFEAKPVLKIVENRHRSLLHYSKDHGLIIELDGFPVSVDFKNQTFSDLVGIPHSGFYPVDKNKYYINNNGCIGMYSNKTWIFPTLPNKLFHHKISIDKSGTAFILLFTPDQHGYGSTKKPNKLMDIEKKETIQLDQYFFNICHTFNERMVGISPTNIGNKEYRLVEIDKNGKSLRDIVDLSSWNPRISMASENEIYVMSDNDIKIVNLDTSEVSIVMNSDIKTGQGHVNNITYKSNNLSYFITWEVKDGLYLSRIVYELKKKQ